MASLATQFCLELSFGLLLALAFVPKAPVGLLFYRIMGTAAMLPLLGALLAPPLVAGVAWTDPAVLCAGLGLALYPVYSGPVRGARWGLGLGLALAATAAALIAGLVRAGVPSDGTLGLAAFSALATGAVAGSVALAMVLGHWYLTVPNLQVRHLVRLNRVTVGAMVASLVAVALSCALAGDLRDGAQRSLFDAWGLFHLGTRVAVGLLLPLLFAWMTASSLRFGNTRSATGILYASTVLVLIGAAVSISLQDSYGLPL